MKLRSKIAVSAALLGAFTTAQAESITFGVEVPPIASLVVRDGMIQNAATLYQGAGPITAVAADNEVVGGFALITNMPKWNIYFGFGNGGKLQSQAGTQIKDNNGNPIWLGSSGLAAPGATDATAYLVTAEVSSIKATDSDGDAIANLATQGATVTPAISPTFNTMAKALAAAALTEACNTGNTGATPKACVFSTPWLLSFDQTTTNFDIRTGLASNGVVAPAVAGTAIGSVAGTYTETVYLTLVSSY